MKILRPLPISPTIRSLCILAVTAQCCWGAEPGLMPVLAPGVLTVVSPQIEEEETTSPPVELKEITSVAKSWQPHYSATSETLRELASAVILRRPVWQLEFSYKSLRMISLPTSSDLSRSDRRQIWYLVYHVRNPGRHRAPVPKPDEFGHDMVELQPADLPLRFFPTFHLRDHETQQEWLDQVIPEVIPAIHAVEIRDPNVPLHDSVRISDVVLDVSSETTDRGVWGVAMWENVDPELDFASVFVAGLTNAHRWNPEARGTDALTFKTLQLNFWRPGDAVDEHVREFRNGLPSLPVNELARELRRYGMDRPVNFSWRYRP